MRNVRARFELDQKGIDKGHRYSITVGDGSHSEMFTLANPSGEYSDPRWSMLLGDSRRDFSWGSQTSEGIYVSISRQYPNKDFDFEPESYKEHKWLESEVDLSAFRLYNPFLGRPFLQWDTGAKWGDSLSFSEGDQHQFSYTIDMWQFPHNEHDVQWTVRRNDDSDYYKEFVIRLSV